MNRDTVAPARTGGILHAGFGLVFVAVAVWSWVGLCCAEMGVYRSPVVAGVSGLLALACGWRIFRSLRAGAAPMPVGAGVSLAACLAVAVFLFFQPGQYLIDGGDGSVYLNLGRAVARTGSLSFSEPVLDSIEPALWPGLFDREATWPNVYNLFPGGIQLAPGVNRVLPNFFHLFPIWVANLEGVAGPRGGYYVNAVFGVLAVAALWMLGIRLSGLATATAAAALLALNFAEIWFARFPTSEVLTQYLILAGLYFTVCHAQRPTWASGTCAGAGFGLAALCRIDVLILVSPIVAVYLACAARGERTRYWIPFVAVFSALTLHAVAHALLWSRPYTERIVWLLAGTGWVKPASLIAPLAVTAAFVVSLWRRSIAPWPGWSRRAVLLIAGVPLAAPVFLFAPRVFNGYPAMLLTTFGIIAAAAGAALLLAERPAPPAVLIVALYAGSGFVYFDSVRDMAPMPMLLRRYVPVILPLALLLTAHACSRLSSAASRLRWIGWAAPAALGLVFATRSAPLLAAAPMQGVAARLAALAAQLPPDAVVLVDSSSPSHLGLSLHYTSGRDVLWIHRSGATRDAIASLATSFHASGRPLLLVIGSQGARLEGALRRDDFDGFDLRPAGSISLAHLDIEPTRHRLPSVMRLVSPVVDIYQVVPPRLAQLPLQLDIGEQDFAWRGEGLYDAERIGSAVGRWTAGVAVISVPRISVLPDGLAVLRLRLAGPRPPSIPPPRVQVDVGDLPIGVVGPLTGEFRTYSLPLDAAVMRLLASGGGMLTLVVPPFVPRDAGEGDDGRTLGAAVDWVRIEPR